jgi:hypothetical protein
LRFAFATLGVWWESQLGFEMEIPGLEVFKLMAHGTFTSVIVNGTQMAVCSAAGAARVRE